MPEEQNDPRILHQDHLISHPVNDLLDSVDTLGQINFNNAVSSGLCIVACYFGFTTDEIKDLFYAWASPDKLPRDVRRAFELEARKQITGSRAASSVTSAEIQMAVKKLGYKKLRDRLSTKAAAKLAKVLAPNAVPTIGQVVSAIMAASELATVCDCFWKCGLKNFF